MAMVDRSRGEEIAADQEPKRIVDPEEGEIGDVSWKAKSRRASAQPPQAAAGGRAVRSNSEITLDITSSKLSADGVSQKIPNQYPPPRPRPRGRLPCCRCMLRCHAHPHPTPHPPPSGRGHKIYTPHALLTSTRRRRGTPSHPSLAQIQSHPGLTAVYYNNPRQAPINRRATRALSYSYCDRQGARQPA